MSATTMVPREPPRGRERARPKAPAEIGLGRLLVTALADAARRGLAALRLWRERAEERRRLAEMPDYLLKDMGLPRVQAEAEARKPFWRA